MPEYRIAPVFDRPLCPCEGCWAFEVMREARRVRLMVEALEEREGRPVSFRGHPGEHWAAEDRIARARYLDHVEALLGADHPAVLAAAA